MMHHMYIQGWEHMKKVLITNTPLHDQHTFNWYVEWLHRSTRTHLKGSYTDQAIDEDPNEDDTCDAYDDATRMET
jgi:hypothetical protein